MGILSLSLLSWIFDRLAGPSRIRLYAAASILYDLVSFAIITAYVCAAWLAVLLFCVITADLILLS